MVSVGICTYTEVKIGTPKSAELRTTKPRGGVHAHHEALACMSTTRPMRDGRPAYFWCENRPAATLEHHELDEVRGQSGELAYLYAENSAEIASG